MYADMAWCPLGAQLTPYASVAIGSGVNRPKSVWPMRHQIRFPGSFRQQSFPTLKREPGEAPFSLPPPDINNIIACSHFAATDGTSVDSRGKKQREPGFSITFLKL